MADGLLAQVTAFFRSDDWQFAELDDGTGIQLAFQGNSGAWACLVRVREEEQRVLFYSYLPARVSPERRMAAADFLTRANYGLMLGNFEMDMEDGEVRFKTSIDVDGVPWHPGLMRQLVYCNVFTVDRYFQATMAVALTEMDPMDAIRMAEGDPILPDEA